MEIALPTTDEQGTIYCDNPYTAPKFAIYTIMLVEKTDIRFSLKSIVDNPLYRLKCNDFEEDQRKCNCDMERASSMKHIFEHYALLDILGGCSYLLANSYCKNVERTMKNGGIIIYKIPPIIKKVDMAIKNFLIGVSLANQVQYIHDAS
jgi:predicted Fe-Mo cluster-binding NifX family protein